MSFAARLTECRVAYLAGLCGSMGPNGRGHADEPQANPQLIAAEALGMLHREWGLTTGPQTGP